MSQCEGVQHLLTESLAMKAEMCMQEGGKRWQRRGPEGERLRSLVPGRTESGTQEVGYLG